MSDFDIHAYLGDAESHVTPLPNKPRRGWTAHCKTPAGRVHATVNLNPADESQPFDVFFNISKAGTDLDVETDATARLVSLVLRMDSPLTGRQRLALIHKQLKGLAGPRAVGSISGREIMPDETEADVGVPIRSVPDGLAHCIRQVFEVLKWEDDLNQPKLTLDPEKLAQEPLKQDEVAYYGKHVTVADGVTCPYAGKVTRAPECPECGAELQEAGVVFSPEALIARQSGQHAGKSTRADVAAATRVLEELDSYVADVAAVAVQVDMDKATAEAAGMQPGGRLEVLEGPPSADDEAAAKMMRLRCPHDGAGCTHDCLPSDCFRVESGSYLSAPHEGYPLVGWNADGTRVVPPPPLPDPEWHEANCPGQHPSRGSLLHARTCSGVHTWLMGTVDPLWSGRNQFIGKTCSEVYAGREPPDLPNIPRDVDEGDRTFADEALRKDAEDERTAETASKLGKL